MSINEDSGRKVNMHHKLLLMYVACYLNEVRFGLWNNGKSHGFEKGATADDRELPLPDKGCNYTVMQTFLDKTSFSGKEMKDVPKLVREAKTIYPTKVEGEAIRW